MTHFIFRLLLVLAVLLGTPSMATDQRIQLVDYIPERIVVVHGRTGVQTMIIFNENERIENIAVGDSSAWQVTPNKRANLLFLKPVRPAAETNMTVITDRRVYMFDLRATGGKASVVYSLRFLYPPEPEVPEVEAVAEITKAETEAAAAAEVSSFDPSKLNLGWTKKGKKALYPSSIFDDGQLTYLKWDASSDPPAIFVPQAGGLLTPVNQSVQNGYVVIDHVPRRIVLRLGKAEATLENANPPKPLDAIDVSNPTKG